MVLPALAHEVRAGPFHAGRASARMIGQTRNNSSGARWSLGLVDKGYVRQPPGTAEATRKAAELRPRSTDPVRSPTVIGTCAAHIHPDR